MFDLLEDAGYVVPRPGWPGRRLAILRILLAVTFQAVFLLAFVAALVACVLLVWASMPAVPR